MNSKYQNVRVSIPADLRRRILIECGHRCSIPTCKHPNIEIHHIIPWESCHKHEFTNLIALCPNCHTRAHKNEIDRKSLRRYKENLKTIESGSIFKKGEKWIPKNLSEERSTDPIYETSLWYPLFNEIKFPDLRELNLLIEGRMYEIYIQNRKFLLDRNIYESDSLSEMSNELICQFEILGFNEDLVSIKYDYFNFSIGMAHPQHYTSVENYLRKPIIKLELYDLLETDTSLNKIIPIIRKRLNSEWKKYSSSIDQEWIANGTKADWNNFKNFNLDNSSNLIFTFDEYQVGPYAYGAFTVKIKLESILNEITPYLKKILIKK